MNLTQLLQSINQTQLIRPVALVLDDLQKRLNQGANKILFWSAVGTLIMGSFYRYLRVAPGFKWVDNVNYLLLAPICVFLPYYLLKNELLKLDGLFLLSLFTFSLTYFIAGTLTSFKEQLLLVASYILPIFSYFLFRYSRISERQIVNALLFFAMTSSILILAEFIFSNYLGSHFFQLAFHNFLSETRGVEIEKTVRNIPFFPGSGIVVGIWGNAGSPFATAGLFVALLFYGVALYRYRPHFKKRAFTIALLSFLCFYLCGSKTAYMIAIMMLGIFWLGFNPITMSLMLGTGFASMLLFMLSMGGGMAGIMTDLVEGGILKSFISFGNAFIQTDPQYWFYLLFGQGEASLLHPAEFQGEIDYLDQLIRVGVLNYILLITILATYVQSVLTIPNADIRRSQLPSLIFFFTLILSGLHYDAIFKYPNNIIVTALMGYTMNWIGRSYRSA